MKATTRGYNTAIYFLRAKQIGFTLSELEDIEEGFVIDMIIESGNDHEEYAIVATQADFDAF